MAKNQRICSVEGCNKPARTRAMCSAHYQMWRLHGDPLGGSRTFGAGSAFCKLAANHTGEDDCLIWPYGKTSGGYGVTKSADGKRTTAHRVICEMAHGRPPTENHVAAHSCGNGHLGCVNPHHLRWATCKENSQEMVLHGTSPKGERCGHAKLTDADVREIRDMRGLVSLGEIAGRFGVSKMTVSDIHLRKTWKHLA